MVSRLRVLSCETQTVFANPKRADLYLSASHGDQASSPRRKAHDLVSVTNVPRRHRRR